MLGGWAYAPIIEVETHREAPSDRRAGANRNRSHDRLRAPVLGARRRGPAVWLADSLDGLHPAVLFVVVMLAGLVVIAAFSIGLGFLITSVVEHAWGIGAADERVNVWLAAHRTRPHGRLAASVRSPLEASCCRSSPGSIALVCVVLRKWRIAAFVVFALAVESAAYRATTLVVHVHRPRVVRLESLPVDASYPSGHTARLDRGLRRPRAAATSTFRNATSGRWRGRSPSRW